MPCPLATLLKEVGVAVRERYWQELWIRAGGGSV